MSDVLASSRLRFAWRSITAIFSLVVVLFLMPHFWNRCRYASGLDIKRVSTELAVD